jgi:hypothetical protein
MVHDDRKARLVHFFSRYFFFSLKSQDATDYFSACPERSLAPNVA